MENVTNKDENFKKLDTSDFGSDGDLDARIETMDKNAIAEDEAFKNDFGNDDLGTGMASELLDEGGDEAAEELVPGAETVNEDSEQDDSGEEDAADGIQELKPEDLEDGLTEAEERELSELNEKFNTKFKSIDEFNKALKGQESQEDPLLKEIEQKKTFINYYDKVLTLSDEDIIYEDKRIRANQNGMDISNQEVLDKIREEVEEAVSNGTSEYIARSIRESTELKNNQYKQDVKSYNDSKTKTETELAESNKMKLQEATSNLYKQEKFYGLELDRQKYIDAYKKASNKDLIKELEANPALLVEMQLLFDNRENLSKISGNASYSDGIKDTFDAIKGQNPKTVKTVGNNNNRKSGVSSLIADFIK